MSLCVSSPSLISSQPVAESDGFNWEIFVVSDGWKSPYNLHEGTPTIVPPFQIPAAPPLGWRCLIVACKIICSYSDIN